MHYDRQPPPRGQNRAVRGIALTAMLAVACIAASDSAAATDAEPLGEVRLALTKQPPLPPAEQRPRIALFLIDCSLSMHDGVSGRAVGPGSPQRWDEVKTGLRQTLEQLQQASPGIEVRLRFFSTWLDCRPAASAILKTPADVELLMAKAVPEVLPEYGTTALIESTVKCVEELRKENRQRKFEWWMFGVFSDGADGVDETKRARPTTTKEDRDAQLRALRDEGATKPIVWTVGPDAKKAAADGDTYGPVTIQTIKDSIPVPPKPPTRYALDLANGQSPGIQINHPAKAGRHTLVLNVGGDVPAGPGMIVTPQIVRDSPFRILTKELTVRQGAPTVVELDLPQDVDRAQGASASFVFRASTSSGASAEAVSFEGEPQVTFTYTADRTLPKDQWNLTHLPAERRGVQTFFAATPGQASSPLWVFKGPNGVVEREEGLVVRHAFSEAGKWECEFSCISESGDKLSRPADPIDIVDAAFSISPAQASIGIDESMTFKIVPAQAATSPAHYDCLLDGREIPLGPDGKTITLPRGNIDQIGRHTLAVVAKSRLGGFEWRSDAAVSVKASPRVGITPTEFVEGRDSVSVTIQAAGDIGGSVIVLANGEVVDEYPVFYPSTDVQVAQVEAKIPTIGIKQPQLDIIVRPKKEGACPEATAKLKGRAADIHANQKSPASGTPVSAKGGRQIVLEPAGDNAGDVGDIDFEVALVAPDEAPKESGLIADKANRWTVAIPRRPHLGKTDIYAKPVGGRLRPDLFPKVNDGWKKIGTLEIVPEAQWIPFILSLLGILAVLYFTWTALGKNESRHWVVQTTLRDPGQSAEDEKFDGSTRLWKRDRASASTLNSESQLLPYNGWPLGNWLPRIPRDFPWVNDIGSKDTNLLLWQIAAKHNAKWLHKAVASNPNLSIVVRGGWKRQPFLGLPDSTANGLPWEKTTVEAARPNETPSYSETYRLRHLVSSPQNPSIWIRVKQPQKVCWEHWVMGTLLAIAVPLVAYLLKLFYCV